MSIVAMVWAMKDAPVDSPLDAMILTAMADQTNDDGTEFRRTMGWLAPRARCGVSTLYRRMRILEQRGVIRRGDQSLARGPAGRVPVVWDLAIELKRPVQEVTDQPAHDPSRSETPPAARGVPSHGWEGSPLACDRQNPSLPPAPVPSLPPVAPHDSEPPVGPAAPADSEPAAELVLIEATAEPTTAEAFEAWWASYPRKIGKGAARTAYTKATAKTTIGALAAGLERALPSWSRCEVRFIPHPSTWLNREGWDDVHDATEHMHPTDVAMARNLARIAHLEHHPHSAAPANPWEITS